MEHTHKTTVPAEEDTKAAIARNKDIRTSMGEAKVIRDKEKEVEELNALTRAADIATVRIALLRLVILHDLPLNLPEWPQFHTLVYSINHCAIDTVFKSRGHFRRYIHENYLLKQAAIKHELHDARSRIHLGTDTWHSPNRHELQGVTAHFVDRHGKLQKVLLAIPELFEGHGGEKVAPRVLDVLQQYGIKDKIGYVVGDNHSANDTLCRALADSLTEFDPVERRLRCFCHMVNLAVQAFLYAENDQAVDYADALTAQSKLAVDDQVNALRRGKDSAGWINNSDACQKVLGFCKTVRTSDMLYNAFKRITCGRVIHSPNDTRWNSVYQTLTSARAVSGHYSQFIHERPAVSKYEMSIDDWHQIDETVAFLEPFKELTKRCEGDYVTLDKVQESMDYLVHHYEQQRALHSSNAKLSHALYTSWFAFDKYYNRIDETGVYAAAILLNPNLRKSYLDTTWKKQWIASGLRRARDIWSQYASEELTPDEDVKVLSGFDQWRSDRMKKQRVGKASDEFNRFINAASDTISMPVLDWWQQPSQKEAYPRLHRMGIDILSAPSTSAEGERVFSHGRRVIPWTRAQLASVTIEELMCLKHWLLSGVVDDIQPLIIADGVIDDDESAESDDDGDMDDWS